MITEENLTNEVSNFFKKLKSDIVKIRALTTSNEIVEICNYYLEIEKDPNQKEMKL